MKRHGRKSTRYSIWINLKNIKLSCRRMLCKILEIRRAIYCRPFVRKKGYNIGGLEIYYKPYSTYMIFFVVEDATVTVIRVLKDRMYWQAILHKMNKINR